MTSENFEQLPLLPGTYRAVLPQELIGCRIRLNDQDYEIVAYSKDVGHFVLVELADRAEYSW